MSGSLDALRAGALVLLLGGAVVAAGRAQAPQRGPQPAQAGVGSAHGADGYVGSRACSQCHSDVYRRFSQTDMGRSLSEVSPALIGTLRLPGTLDVAGQNRHFEVFARDGKLYESESQPGADGADVFRDTHEVSWILGAGANGFGALIRRDGYLFQGPLSFYSRSGAWGLSPGYEFGDYGFNRPILAGCLGCHAGRPKPVPGTNGQYESPPFTQLSIGCENCHGPGSAHIAAMESGDPRSHIVNPARLTAPRANDLCMSCHQMGDLRIFREGRTYADFRPGQPLSETLAILLVPPRREAPPDVDHLDHYYSMSLSKCFRASGGRLRCITCHDPHEQPRADEAAAYFSQKCLTCHTRKSCTLSMAAREKQNDNCIGCHMPRRDVQTIQHASATNHRILARPDEPFPEAAFHQATAALPDLIQLDPAPDQTPPPSLTLLRAYGELLDTHPEYADRYAALLNQLEQTTPHAELVQAALGRRDLRSGNPESAIEHLRNAIAIGPPQAVTYADLAAALDKLGHHEEALDAQQKAVALDPFNPVLQKSEIVFYINLRQYPQARTALEHYLQVFPQDSFMRRMLTMANSGAPPQ